MAVGYRADAQNHTVSLALGTISQFSATCWVRLNADRNAFSTFWDLGTSSSNLFGFQTRSDGTTVETYDTNGSTGTHSAALTVGTWYYFAINVNGVNGNWQYRAANTATFTAGSWTSGTATLGAATLLIGESGFNGEWLNGDVAAFKMWHTVNLTTEQMHQESYTYLPQRYLNLTCVYPLTGQTLTTDYSGNGRTLSGGSGSIVVDGPPIVWGSAYPIIFLPKGPSVQLKDLADSGSSSESLTVVATNALNETSSANDAVSSNVSSPNADSASSSESLGVSGTVALFESANASDSTSASSVTTLGEQGSSVEQLLSTVTALLAETGNAANSVVISRTAFLTDTGSSTESLSIVVSLGLSETGNSVESVSSAVAALLADTGLGTETLVSGTFKDLDDNAQSSEGISSNATTQLTDTGTSTEVLSVVVTAFLSETGTSTEDIDYTSALPIGDSGFSVESLSVVVTSSLADSGSAVAHAATSAVVSLADVSSATEDFFLGALKAVGDSGSATDSLAVLVALSLADAGSTTEIALADGTRLLSDFASSFESLSRLDLNEVIPGKMVLGDTTRTLIVLEVQRTAMVEGRDPRAPEANSGSQNGSGMENR